MAEGLVVMAGGGDVLAAMAGDGDPFFPPTLKRRRRVSRLPSQTFLLHPLSDFILIPTQASVQIIIPTQPTSNEPFNSPASPTETGLLSATAPPLAQSASSQHNGPSSGLIIGAIICGMLLGALVVTFLFCWRLRTRRQEELLLPIQDREKGIPFTEPALPTGAKVMDWIRRNRVVSVATISSFGSPTVIDSGPPFFGVRTSSLPGASPSGTSRDIKRQSSIRPPGLARISE
ncbi:hypothetical protein B0H13DRAFT_1884046 [Mycena leptocephala]|nr:hypothetical protein B0H13DRAFT_1884046 [Mycena leptocephala]